MDGEKRMDEIDVSQEQQDKLLEARLLCAQNEARRIVKGNPGMCVYCGEFFERVVNDACGRCRDELKLD